MALLMKEIAQEISEMIFNGAPDTTWGHKFVTSNKGLRSVRVGKFLQLIEQNPDTGTRFARLAREGRRIIWAFNEGKYWVGPLGTRGIIDGVWQENMHDAV